MPQKQYLDDNGNPTSSPIYLDDNGNPVGGSPDLQMNIAKLKAMVATYPKAKALQKPGYFSSLASSLGIPTSMTQAADLVSDQQGNLPSQPQVAVANAFENVGRGIASGIRSGVGQAREAIANIRSGGPILSNAGKAASGYMEGLSAVNPSIAAGGTAGQQVGQGNLTGAAGSLTGGMISGALMMSGGEKPGKPQLPPAIQHAMDVDALTNAVNPIPKEMPTVRQQLSAYKNDIAASANRNNIPITDRASFARATQSAANEAHQSFRSLLDKASSIDQTQPVPGSPWATTKSLPELYGRLTEINATLNPRYAKGGVAGQAAVAAENVAPLRAEAAAIRSELYGRMGNALGMDPQDIASINQRAGSLRDLADTIQYYSDEALNQENKIRQQPIDLHTTATGLAARAGERAIARTVGPKADRMIRGVFQNYQPR